MSKFLAPVVVFAYNRPDHLKQTLDSLSLNELAGETEVFIYSDGAKKLSDEFAVNEVRTLARQIFPFKNISIIERPSNFGLAKSIIEGVTEMVARHGKVIVLEDDMISSRYFLKYMNEALTKYESHDEIISVHGYVYPLKKKMTQPFFLKGADCWGWATWERGWKLFNPSSKDLYAQLNEKGLLKRFDFNVHGTYSEMLLDNISGKNNSWAIRWYASALLSGKLTLYPATSLIFNIGLDDSGTHCRADNSYDVDLAQEMPTLPELPIQESEEGLKQFSQFFRDSSSKFRRNLRQLVSTIRKII